MREESFTERLNVLTNRYNNQQKLLEDLIRQLNGLAGEVRTLRECLRVQMEERFRLLYKELYDLKVTDCYSRFFCNDGLLYFFACICGYMKRYAADGENPDRKVMSRMVGRYVTPIQNRIVLLRSLLKRHADSEEEITKSEMNLYEITTSDDMPMLQQRLQNLCEQVDERRADANRIFYDRLWTLVEPCVAQIEGGCFDGWEAGGDVRAVGSFMDRMKDALEQGGLAIDFAPEGDVPADDGRFTKAASAEFATPAVWRKSDGHVFVKGVVPVKE